MLLVLKLTKDTGAGSEIIGIEGFLAPGNLDRSPRDDEAVPPEADVHIFLLDQWQVKDRRDR